MLGLRLTSLTRHERERFPAYYTATVVNGDDAVLLTSELGSWATYDGRRHARPDVAAWLQREVGKLERAVGRAA